jgi:ABC-2 type transport system permease protein
MPGIVFIRKLKDQRNAILGWGIALGAYALMMVLIFPSIGGMEELQDYLDAMPDVFKAMIGDVDLTSPAGFLSGYYFNYMPLLLAVFAVLAGAAAVGGEEKRGTMDLLISNPIPRWRMLTEKFAAFIVALAAIVLLTSILMGAGMVVTPEIRDGLDLGGLVEATVNIMPATLLFGAMAFLLSAALPGRIPSAVVAAGLLIASYLLNLLGEVSTALEPLQKINPFYYYGTATMVMGVDWGNMVLLLMASLVLFAIALFSFQRRDLTV